jgi:hypothetical protein
VMAMQGLFDIDFAECWGHGFKGQGWVAET